MRNIEEIGTMNEEYMRILKMIEEGKVTAEEGAELMQAVGGTEAGTEQELGGKKTSMRGRKLRIKVTDLDTGKDKVNIRIPLRLAKIAERFIPKDAKEDMRDKGIDLEDIMGSLNELQEGPIVDIDASDNGKSGEERVNVSIYVE